MSSTPTSGGKKLVQARLPFQVFRTSPNDSQPPKKKLAIASSDVKTVDDSEDLENLGVVPIVCLDNSPKKTNGTLTDDLTSGKRKGDDECIELESESAKKPKIEEPIKGLSSIAKLRKFQLVVTPRPQKSVTGACEYFPKSEKLEVTVKPDTKFSQEVEVIDVDSANESKVPEVVTIDDGDGKAEEIVTVEDGSRVQEICSTDEDDIQDVTAENSLEEVSENEEEGTILKVPAVDSGSTQIEEMTITSQAGVTEITTPKSKKIRNKTPKQLEKLKEMEKKREERERLRVEALTKKQQEKEEKQKMKEEKELQKKKELEEKEEAKRKAKEDKEKKRLQEIEMKNEEKKRKEEERKKREDEALKRKEEDALAKENKFAKEAAVFTTFFTKVDPQKIRKSEGSVVTVGEKVLFKPFAIKNRMRMAPTNRNPLTPDRRNVLDSCLERQDVEETYITQLRCGDIIPGKSPNTWPCQLIFQDEEAEVEELPVEIADRQPESQKPRGPRAKLLQFRENRRPPYWGTWRKKCAKITARHPFGIYKEFEYDVDSDDEWEEEEPGESLHGSDDEKEKDEDNEEDEYNIDNDFFVPHGYLSEDEAPDEHWSVEQQKEKLKLLGEQFDQERNEKTRQLRPVVIGCIWTSADSDANPKILALLERCRPWSGDEVTMPIVIGAVVREDANLADDEEKASPPPSRRGVFPPEAIPALIARTHGATVRRKAIAKAFSSAWADDHPESPILTLASVGRKVKELAQWVECPEPPMQGRLCWYVSPAVREQHGCGHLVLPSRDPPDEEAETVVPAPNTPKITKFTKVLTEEERRKSMQMKASISNTSDCAIIEPEAPPATPSPIVEKALKKLNRFKAPPAPIPASTASTGIPVKKRVALVSVPFGVPFAKPSTSTPIDSPTTMSFSPDTPPAPIAVEADSPLANGTICISSDTDDAPSSEACELGDPKHQGRKHSEGKLRGEITNENLERSNSENFNLEKSMEIAVVNSTDNTKIYDLEAEIIPGKLPVENKMEIDSP